MDLLSPRRRPGFAMRIIECHANLPSYTLLLIAGGVTAEKYFRTCLQPRPTTRPAQEPSEPRRLPRVQLRSKTEMLKNILGTSHRNLFRHSNATKMTQRINLETKATSAPQVSTCAPSSIRNQTPRSRRLRAADANQRISVFP